MEIKIDSGITPPPDLPRFGELLRKLEVHENEKSKSSFAVTKEHANRLRNAVNNAHRDTTMKFMTRTVKERDPVTRKMTSLLRVWRIE